MNKNKPRFFIKAFFLKKFSLFFFLFICENLWSGTFDKNSVSKGVIEFVENNGQVADMNNHLRPDILFSGEAGGMKIYLRKTGISYVMVKKEERMSENSETAKMDKESKVTREDDISASPKPEYFYPTLY